MADRASSIDIVIVNHNSTPDLLRCLESVYASLGGISAEIYVQDNDSEDDVDRVTSLFPRIHFTRNDCNLGFAKAANNGVTQGSAPYVVFLNPDTYVKGDFFESLVRYLDENLDVGVVGPQVLNDDGTVQGSARSFPTPLTALFGRSSLLTRWLPNNPISRRNVLIDRCDGATPLEVDWVSGACMAARRKALDDVGYFDERFFLYWEDADLCKRMWESKWRVVYFPKTSVVHYVGGSSGDRPKPRILLEFHRSAYRLFAKHARGPLRLAQPFAVSALALRFIFVLAIHEIFRRPGRTARERDV